MGLNQNIAMARKRIGLTQEQLAEKCRVSRQAVTKWESGESEPTISKLLFLSEILDMDIEELITGREKDSLNNKPERISLNYSLLTAMTNDLTIGTFCLQRESWILIHLELMYDIIKTKYVASSGKVYEEYLLENTTQEERCKIVKHLMCGRGYAKEAFQTYIDGECEIDIAFDKLIDEINEREETVSKIEDKKEESQIAVMYYKICGLLRKMQSFEDYNEKKLDEIDEELQNLIREQNNESHLGRMTQAFLYDVEYAWKIKDKEVLEELYSDLYELKTYVWRKIK